MFAVIGEALIDMVQPVPGLDFEAQPGGGPLNIAVGLRRLGHPAAFVGRVSTRPLGELVRGHILANGLDLESCVSTGDQTTLAFASLDEHGKAAYDFYVQDTADWGWTDDELRIVPADCKVVHTGSLAAFLLPGADALVRLWQRYRSQGELLLSFDPNVRPALVGPREDAVSRVEQFVAASHIVKASDDDVGWLYPDLTPEEVLRHWSGLGSELVVVTLGPDGCLAMAGEGGLLHVPGRAVEVADTIGAGDAFVSGLLSGIADTGSETPGAVTKLSEADLRSVLQRAVVVSAMTCRRAGADPPSRREYDGEAAGRELA